MILQHKVQQFKVTLTEYFHHLQGNVGLTS